MIRLKIDKVKNFIPSSIAKGSTSARMQKARAINLAFYDELQYSMKNNEINPKTFAQKLKSLIGGKIGIRVIETTDKNDSFTSCCFNEKAESIGYVISLPFNYYTKKINHNYAKTFLNKTQELLNLAINPKILKRYVAIMNKGYDIKGLEKFYNENLANESVLSPNALNGFLKEKSNAEKIDLLQFMRYKLLSEQNTSESTFYIDKKIEKYNGFKYIRSEDYYDMSKYHYDEKLNQLNKRLFETIQEESNKLINKNPKNK